MISDVCTGRIAVVGNGPLSEEQRAEINDPSRYDCIVRFNDRKNMKPGERTTVHAVRDIPAKTFFQEARRKISHVLPFVSYSSRKVPGIDSPESGVYVQPVTARFEEVRRQFEGHDVLPPIFVSERGTDIPSRSYFPGCNACQTIYNCESSSTSAGPSTGTSVIEVLNASQSTSYMDVFGMNWNGGNHHFDFKQPDLVSTCCDKCIIHPTVTHEYI